MKPRRSFGAQQPTRAQHRVGLQALLVQRESLDGVNVESLARSFGLAAGEIEQAVAAERQRRAG